MAEPYQTPPSLVVAEQRLNEALDGLTKGLEGVEALSGVASAFSDASHANKAVVAAFQEASSSFEKSSATTLASMESLAQRVLDNQREVSETLEAAFQEASSSFEKSVATTFESLESIAQRVAENQSEFSERLSKIHVELSSQNKKIYLLMFLAFVPIVLIAILLFLSSSNWQYSNWL